MSRFLKTKMKTEGKKHDYKNLKHFSYQVDGVKKDEAEKKKKMKLKQIKNYHHG